MLRNLRMIKRFFKKLMKLYLILKETVRDPLYFNNMVRDGYQKRNFRLYVY